jgi:hypothetical protein
MIRPIQSACDQHSNALEIIPGPICNITWPACEAAGLCSGVWAISVTPCRGRGTPFLPAPMVLVVQGKPGMASAPSASRIYQNIHSTDNSRMHLGDVYNNHQSPDERALMAILDSLSYPGMTDRRDALVEAHEKTFDWTFLEGKTNFLVERNSNGNPEYDSYDTVDMNFRSWLGDEDQSLFCVTGKPGSGKSTFMCV